MNPRIKKQIIAIQESGLTNMLDTNYVQRLAHERNADYDRGWDIEPSDAAVEKALQYVLATYN